MAASANLERRAGSSRVRRPPKRLMSPPPQPQSLSHTTATFAATTNAAPASTKAASPTANATAQTDSANAALSDTTKHRSKGKSLTPPTQAPAPPAKVSKNSRSMPQPSSSSTDVEGKAFREDAEVAASNSSKRKRKPSTMTRPPETITSHVGSSSSPPPASAAKASTQPDTLTQPAPTSLAAKSNAPATKVRLSLNGVRGGGQSKAKALRDSQANVRRKSVAASAIKTATDGMAGYDSDGGQSAGVATHLARHRDGQAETEAESEAIAEDDRAIEAPPFIFQHRHLQPSAMRRGSSGVAAGGMRSSSLIAKNLSSSTSRKSHSRTKSMPSIGGLPRLDCLPPAKRSFVDVHGRGDLHSEAETSDGEEDDFHRAMLDGDFDSFDEWSQHPYSGSAAGATTDVDTPATTPRSPQSVCEPASLVDADKTMKKSASVESSESTHSTSKEVEAKLPPSSSSASALRDEVFSHALPPSSRRVKTHAGLLTLSLPYDEHTPTIVTTQASTSTSHGHGVDSSNKDGASLSHLRFSTPSLERRASRGRVAQVVAQSAEARSDEQQRSFRDLDTTSPPLSPTHTLLAFSAAPKTSGPLYSGTVSMTASPFLSAVSHAPLSTLGLTSAGGPSRGTSPVPVFNLTAAPHDDQADTDAPDASPASTHRDLPDVSPFPSRASRTGSSIAEEEEQRSEIGEGNSPQQDVLHDDGFAAVARARLPEHEEDSGPSSPLDPLEEPVFGLPETMDLDDIDAAYGGCGVLHESSLESAGPNVATAAGTVTRRRSLPKTTPSKVAEAMSSSSPAIKRGKTRYAKEADQAEARKDASAEDGDESGKRVTSTPAKKSDLKQLAQARADGATNASPAPTSTRARSSRRWSGASANSHSNASSKDSTVLLTSPASSPPATKKPRMSTAQATLAHSSPMASNRTDEATSTVTAASPPSSALPSPPTTAKVTRRSSMRPARPRRSVVTAGGTQ
ncbi:unnamed protein product [Jaminaea pallidilutea]